MKYDYFVVGSELEWIYDKCDDKLVNSSDDKRLEALWKIKRQDRQRDGDVLDARVTACEVAKYSMEQKVTTATLKVRFCHVAHNISKSSLQKWCRKEDQDCCA